MQIRRATLSDLTRIIAIYAMDPLTGSEDILRKESQFRYASAFHIIDADPNQLLLVAEVDGQIIGTLQVTCIQHLISHAFRRAVIEAVFVDPAHQGRGAGRCLIKAANDWAHSKGCVSLELTSNKKRADAHRFYEKTGFTASHEGYKRAVAEPDHDSDDQDLHLP